LFHFCLFCATWAGWNKTKADPERDENALGLGAGTAKTIICELYLSSQTLNSLKRLPSST